MSYKSIFKLLGNVLVHDRKAFSCKQIVQFSESVVTQSSNLSVGVG